MLGQQIFDARTSRFFHEKTLWSTKSFLGASSAHKALQSPLTEVAHSSRTLCRLANNPGLSSCRYSFGYRADGGASIQTKVGAFLVDPVCTSGSTRC
jgi:hypothetical protein